MKPRTIHHRVLLCIIGARRRRSDNRVLSYNRPLELTGYEYRGHITGEEVVVGGGSDSHGRWTAPQACYGWDNKGWGQERTGWARERVGNMPGKRRPVYQDPTKLPHAARDAQSWTKMVTERGRRLLTEWRKEEEEKSKTRQKRTIK